MTHSAADPVANVEASLAAASERQQQLQSALQQAGERIADTQAEKQVEEETRGALSAMTCDTAKAAKRALAAPEGLTRCCASLEGEQRCPAQWPAVSRAAHPLAPSRSFWQCITSPRAPGTVCSQFDWCAQPASWGAWPQPCRRCRQKWTSWQPRRRPCWRSWRRSSRASHRPTLARCAVQLTDSEQCRLSPTWAPLCQYCHASPVCRAAEVNQAPGAACVYAWLSCLWWTTFSRDCRLTCTRGAACLRRAAPSSSLLTSTRCACQQLPVLQAATPSELWLRCQQAACIL